VERSLLIPAPSPERCGSGRPDGPVRRPSLAIIGTKGLPFVYSGYETFVRELCGRLKYRYDIHVYCHRALFSSRPGSFDGVRLHYLPGI